MDNRQRIASYDIDGVIFLGNHQIDGLIPGDWDVIITGRSLQEERETREYLLSRRITNHVFYNPLPYDMKSRSSSGHHKADTIKRYNDNNEWYRIVIHYEDDPIQAEIIRSHGIEGLFVVHVNTNGMINLENKRHDDE